MAAQMLRTAADYGVYGRCETNPARPQTELALLVLKDSKGNCDLKLLEQYIIVTRITNKKFDINERDNEIGFSAMHWAVTCHNIPAVRILRKHGASIHVRDKQGFTPLFYCTSNFPDADMANFLIEECKANVDERSDCGNTCLQGSCYLGLTEIVKVLLKHGADPRACNNDGTTAFQLASSKPEILDLLHKANTKVDSSLDKEATPCANCGKARGLKRCSRCQVTYYCSKECQRIHWKKGNHKATCEDGVIAEPSERSGYQMALTNILGPQNPAIALVGGFCGSKSKDMPSVKRFVVKVVLPISMNEEMLAKDLMVYNIDRSVDLFIKESTAGYDRVVKKIKDEGIQGIKAYFWAERVPENDKLVKVFPGKLAPTQNW